eukprot:gene10084-21016_t
MSFVIGVKHDSRCPGQCSCKEVSGLGLSIWSAAQYNDYDTIVRRITKDTSLLNKTDSFGYSALHLAAQNDNIKIVQYLLSKRAQVDGSPTSGCGATPLHRAAYAGHVKICTLLLDAGANINATDSSFRDLRTPLHKAASTGHIELYDLLISRGADINIKDAHNEKASEILGKVLTEKEKII